MLSVLHIVFLNKVLSLIMRVRRAEEIIELYQKGHRDFKGFNLKGQCFKGEDLSGSDFTGADIRGADFTNAILKKSDFSGVTTGLQSSWSNIVAIAGLLVTFFSGIVIFIGTELVFWIPSQLFASWKYNEYISVIAFFVFFIMFFVAEKTSFAFAFLSVLGGVSGLGLMASFICLSCVFGRLFVTILEDYAQYILLVNEIIPSGSTVISEEAQRVIQENLDTLLSSGLSELNNIKGWIYPTLVGATANVWLILLSGLMTFTLFGVISITVIIFSADSISCISLPVTLLIICLSIAWFFHKGPGSPIIDNLFTVMNNDNTFASIDIGWHVSFGWPFVVAPLEWLFLILYSVKKLMSEDTLFENIRAVSMEISIWRGTSFYGAVLTDSSFKGALLRNSKFKNSKLVRTCFYKCLGFKTSDFRGTIFATKKVRDLAVSKKGYDGFFAGLNLRGIDLSNADLKGANLVGADLSNATLENAELSNANLSELQAIGTNFFASTLTGSCLENWNIDSKTLLEEVECNYIYLVNGMQEKRPRNNFFKKNEFQALCQKALRTIDLIFADGIDWKVFFQSFQELRAQYQDEDIAIQAIERKNNGAFVIRLETSAHPEVMRAMEDSIKESYQDKLNFLESQVIDQKIQIEYYKKHNSRLLSIVEIMAENQKNPINQTHIHAKGNIAAIHSGSGDIHKVSQTIGVDLDEITGLINSLKTTAQKFSTEQKLEIEIALEDLEAELANEAKLESNRLRKCLQTLWLVACAIAMGVVGAVDFSNNLLELSEKLDVPLPIELIQQNPHILSDD